MHAGTGQAYARQVSEVENSMIETARLGLPWGIQLIPIYLVNIWTTSD